MSFDYDPFHVMTIVLNGDDTFCYLCESCGGGWKLHASREITLGQMRAIFDEHVMKSHQLTRDDTATWHKGH